MKRFLQAFALGMVIAAVVQVVLPAKPQSTASLEITTLGKGAYRLMLYCSRLSGRDNCTDLQDVNERELESISKVVAAAGPSGVEIKACEWTAFHCSANPNEVAIGNTLGAVLMKPMDAKNHSDGLTVGQPTQPLRSDSASLTNPRSLSRGDQDSKH